MADEHPSEEPRRDAAARGGASQIDVRELADRVYRLMRDEIRLARARGEPDSAPRKD